MVTVVTKTIGPTGRDYTTFTLAEAAVESIATAEFGGTDLVANDGAIVFEADAATYSENFTISSSLTCDPTRNVTYQSAAGGQAVVGNAAFSAVIKITEGAFTTLRRLTIDSTGTSTSTRGVEVFPASGKTCEGCLFDSLTIENPTNVNFGAIELQLESSAAAGGVGSATNPTVIQNCVELGAGNGFSMVGGKTDEIHVKVVNCTFAGSSFNAFSINTANDVTIDAVNNISLGHKWDWRTVFTTGTVTATGSNNFGGGDNPFPAALQGSPYPITATTNTSPGAGDWAVYEAATGKLVNVPDNSVIGEGTATGAPTTDINGEDRIRDTHVDPGAFTTELVTFTKTIGATGRDYATFTAAEADVQNIPTTTNLQQRNEAIVFEADSGTYSENFTISSALTCDSTRNVTYQSAAGGQAVIGNAHAFAIINITNGAFTALKRLKITSTATGASGRGIELFPAAGVSCEGCFFDSLTIENLVGVNFTAIELQLESSAAAGGVGSATNPTVIQNCVELGAGNGFSMVGGKTDEIHVKVVNCTFAGSSFNAFSINTANDVTIDAVNNINLGHQWDWRTVFTTGALTATGSNNFGGSDNPFPAALQGSPYPITASTAYDPGAGDFALYVSSTGQLLDSPHNDVIGGGVGPTVNADVPTTDIVGRARTRSVTNPGAFAVAQATRVVTKTIGPVGRDYATFTLAEAAVTTIATAEFGSTDLVANNGRIEFLADAGTYSESVTFSSSLTTDATRQVTYKPTVGSEHGGDRTAGVIVAPSSGSSLTVNDAFTKVEGLVCLGRMKLNEDGCIADRCIVVDTSGDACEVNAPAGTSAAPVVFKNCVIESSTSSLGINFYVGGAGRPIFAEILNCTFINNGPEIYDPSNNGPVTLALVNNLVLGGQTLDFNDPSGYGVITGSNNFGVRTSTNQFPAAIQGSPYPVTATTNTDPGPGHFAIYDADTGALVNVAANTVWQRGVGPSANSDVPTTDIAGFTRSGATANPGAFAASTSLAQTTNPVARFFTYKRPSSQLFNHHRRVTCVFPDDGPSGNGNTFAVGVAARGFISPVSRDCVAFFVYYTTDGAGGQTSLRLEVARIVGQYSQDAIAEAQPIAVVEKQAVGEAIPAGFDFPGQSHTVAFKVQTFSGATTPESAAEYTAYIDGTAVTFDTFYQSATQDGTTKVITHPAPAVGTTQGRAEAFFWYATADRTDSLGSANYALPQWSDWNQLAVDPDPIFDGEGQSITVEGEGTGTVNFSTALEHVDFAISVQYELPRFDTPFASGHRYTSPRFENSRRVITASATNIDKATMDLIVQFHAARKGIEEPFLFNFPIPDTTTSETYTVITVQFADTAGMVYRRDAENIYSVQLNMIELL